MSVVGVAVPLSLQSDRDSLQRTLAMALPNQAPRFTWECIPDNRSILLKKILGISTCYEKERLCSALLLIAVTEQFDAVAIEHDDNGVRLLFEAAPLFGGVRLQGSFFGRDRLKTLYALEPGDRWSLERHEQALGIVRRTLHDDGFLGAQCEAAWQEGADKVVHVSLRIDRQKCYTVKKIDVIAENGDIDDDQRAIIKSIYKRLSRALNNTYYSKTALDAQVAMLKRFIHGRGFVNARMHVQLKPDHEKKNVALVLTLTFFDKKLFEFIGNRFFSTDVLRDVLMALGEHVVLLPLDIIAEDIRQKYRSEGFFEARVAWYEEADRCFFCITEGKRSAIQRVDIGGVSAWNEHDFLRLFFGKLVGKNYQEDAVQSVRDEVRKAYQEKGYWYPHIECIPHVVEQGIVLEIRVQEGELRFVTNIEVDNPELLSPALFATLVTLEPGGQPIGPDRIKADYEKLMNHFREQGYLSARVTQRWESDGQNFCVRWLLDSGSGVTHCAQPLVVGVSRTKTSYIERECDFSEGDPWDFSAVDRTAKKLRALGVFESVSVIPYDDPGDPLRKGVCIRCQDDDPYEVKIRAGAQAAGNQQFSLSTATYTFGGLISVKNPFGRADRCTLQGDVNRFQRDFSCSYWQPWWCGMPARAEYKVYSVSFDEPLVPGGSKYRLYKLNQNGGLLSIVKEWETQTAGCSLGLEWMAIKDISYSWARAIQFEPRLVDRFVPYVIIEPTYFFDTLDNKLYPHRGSLFVASLKAMMPLDLPRAYVGKFLLEYSYFVPLKRAVGAFRLRAGYIFNDCFSRIMPSERFYLGGAYSLRGYDADLVPPLSMVRCGQRDQWVPIGGKSMVNIIGEVRYPLINALHGVVFFDAGALAQDVLAELYLKGLACGVGFGLRYNTAVGPVRFDIGWPLHHQSSLNSYVWFLTFGQIF